MLLETETITCTSIDTFDGGEEGWKKVGVNGVGFGGRCLFLTNHVAINSSRNTK